MQIIDSGNPIVNQVGKMHFSGNIIPKAWYSTIQRKGKPYMNAINILAEIVYWYRPTEERDEAGGYVKYKKKFADADYLQKSYDQLSKEFGLSKKQTRDAVVFLEKIGVIKRHFRNLEGKSGMKIVNILYIELIPDILQTLTYSSDIESGVYENVDTSLQNKRDVSIKRETAPYGKVETNTKNTAKISTLDFIHPSICQKEGWDNELQKKQDPLDNNTLISVEELTKLYPYTLLREILSYQHYEEECNSAALNLYEKKLRAEEELKILIDYEIIFAESVDREFVDSLLSYMADIVSMKKSMVFDQETYDCRMMGEKFFKLDYSGIQYVIEKYKEASSEIKIKNKRKYLIKMLLTAMDDIVPEYTSRVAYDMSHWFEDENELKRSYYGGI